jgi:predicted ABC-type transport system involved in lysophospholipase L1 biosynthesis ATPase subunit
VGVLGPSGSGKSTLLSILSFTNSDVSASSRVSGTISLGGETHRWVLGGEEAAAAAGGQGGQRVLAGLLHAVSAAR